MNPPVKWVAELPHVREVSLRGSAELAFWKDRLRKENLIPAEKDGKAQILVVAAGTSDLPVAEEAVRTAEFMGNDVERLYDVGVAGLHRLLDQQPLLTRARVIIVVAGMEGALPSVVAGLVSVPVIAVHIKPAFRSTVIAELEALKWPLLEIGEPGREYSF